MLAALPTHSVPPDAAQSCIECSTRGSLVPGPIVEKCAIRPSHLRFRRGGVGRSTRSDAHAHLITDAGWDIAQMRMRGYR